MNICPQCGKELDDREICDVCGFNFNYTLSCPHKLSGKCVHNQKDCFIEGLNLEDCQLFLHSTGIIA